jgi:AcrR family transcriptional regulator
MGRPPKTAVEDIVDAAIELFASRGFKGATIAAIAERVGLTDAGVLHHFPTKAVLIEAALERGLLLQSSRIQEIVEPGGLDAIRRMRTWGSIVEESPELTSLQIVMSTEGIASDSPVRDYVLQRYENINVLIVGLIRQGVDRGEIRPDVDADWEASAIVAYLDGIRLQWFYSDQRVSLQSAVQRYFDLLVERLAIPPAPTPPRRPDRNRSGDRKRTKLDP